MSNPNDMTTESSEPPQTPLPPFTASRYGTAEDALRASNHYWKTRFSAQQAKLDSVVELIEALTCYAEQDGAIKTCIEYREDYPHHTICDVCQLKSDIRERIGTHEEE